MAEKKDCLRAALCFARERNCALSCPAHALQGRVVLRDGMRNAAAARGSIREQLVWHLAVFQSKKSIQHTKRMLCVVFSLSKPDRREKSAQMHDGLKQHATSAQMKWLRPIPIEGNKAVGCRKLPILRCFPFVDLFFPLRGVGRGPTSIGWLGRDCKGRRTERSVHFVVPRFYKRSFLTRREEHSPLPLKNRSARKSVQMPDGLKTPPIHPNEMADALNPE